MIALVACILFIVVVAGLYVGLFFTTDVTKVFGLLWSTIAFSIAALLAGSYAAYDYGLENCPKEDG